MGGLREVYGRSSNKTSRLKTPINTGVSKGNGRSDAFSACTSFIKTQLILIFCFGNTLLSIKFTKRHFSAIPLYLLDIQTVVKLLF